MDILFLRFDVLFSNAVGIYMAYLQSLTRLGDMADRRFRLSRQITSVGRGRENDLVLDVDGVAEQHAIIVFDGDRFTARPSDSDAELLVNKKRVRRKAVLSHEDELVLGEARLRFSLLADEDSPTYSPDPSDTRRLAGLANIHELANRLLRFRDLDELLEDLVDAVIELTGADKGFLLLCDGEEWQTLVARHLHAEDLVDDSRQISDSVLRRVIDTREPLIISDALSDEEFSKAQSVINLKLSSLLCVPLLDRGELLGVIYVGNDKVASLFDEVHLELLLIFASQLSLLISNAYLVNDLQRQTKDLYEKLQSKRFGSIIGASKSMQPVFHAIRRVAPTDVTVLITGETGTGKELIAQELHDRSNRRDGPFITLNCGAIPENLLESELFGHVKGAFTGASARRDGQFHAAHKGTIFLDEIGEMPMQLQVKLLRVLQEQSFSRVGSTQPESVDIRVLAATNRDLQERIEEGHFRSDLYFRLNVIEISLPPLRSRGEDVVLIAEFLTVSICDELGLPQKRLSPGALRALQRYDWPGNIRQLENRIKKALVLATGSTLSAQDLDLSEEQLPPLIPLADAKEQFAMEYILNALEQNGGNRSQTARDLEVDPRTIFRYLKKTPSSC